MTPMNALIHPVYGSADVLRHEQVARPVPREGEVLVKVRAAAVCRGDVYLMTGRPYLVRLMGMGLFAPRFRVPGQDFAGRVEALGAGVSGVAVGDEVYGQARHGAFAEWVCVPVDRLAITPRSLGFEEAAAVPDSALTALQGLRDAGQLKAGERVLINGASGGVGTFAVQLARALGAHVTAVCSTRHVEAVRALGAHEVIDYTRASISGRFDVFFDLVGNHPLSFCTSLLAPRGRFVSSSGGPFGEKAGPLVRMLGVMLRNLFGKHRMVPLVMTPNRADLQALAALIDAGQVRPLIERRFPLALAADAVRHVASGHAQGKTVITV